MGSLLVDAAGKFSNARFEEAKRILYAALGEADRWLAEVLRAAQDASSGSAKAYAAQLKAGVPLSRERLRFFRRQVDAAAMSTNDALWSTNIVPERKITRYAFMLEQIRIELVAHKVAAEALGHAERETFWHALAESAGAFGVRVSEGLGPLVWIAEHLGTVALVALGIVLLPHLLRAGRVVSGTLPAAPPPAGALQGLRWAPVAHLPKSKRARVHRRKRTRRSRGRLREIA